MKKLITAFTIVTALCTASCKRDIHCPGFDSGLLDNWFPYEQGATYTFAANNGDEEWLKPQQVTFTQPYSIPQTPFKDVEHCEVDGRIYAVYNNANPGEVRLCLEHIVQDDRGSSPHVSLIFRTLSTLTFDVNGNELGAFRTIAGYSAQRFEIWDVNGRQYNDIIEIKVTDDSEAQQRGMDRLYIARNAGIIGYRLYPSGTEYWLK